LILIFIGIKHEKNQRLKANRYNIEKIVQAEKIEDRSIHAGGDVIDSTLAAGDDNKL